MRFEKHRNGIEKTSTTVVEYSLGACRNSNEVAKYYVDKSYIEQVTNRKRIGRDEIQTTSESKQLILHSGVTKAL